jgi:glycine cleavage system regulatory protein
MQKLMDQLHLHRMGAMLLPTTGWLSRSTAVLPVTTSSSAVRDVLHALIEQTGVDISAEAVSRLPLGGKI